MISHTKFNDSFSKFGFEKMTKDEKKFTSFCQGTQFGVYLSISDDTFSVNLVFDVMEQKIFYWQHFDSFEEIESLIIKNHILSSEICENVGLAIYT